MLRRSSQIRSPKTAFDAQFLVEAGTPKSRGFSHIHALAAAIGIRQYQPIHARLHTAMTTSDTHVNLVHTLRGLAWRIQASPRSPNKWATLPSVVGPVGVMEVVSCVM